MTIWEMLAFATGPAFLLTRRVWWGLCCATGWYQAAQAGQTIDDKAAFAMGRTQVIATLATAAKGAFDRIEWAAVGAGLALAWKDGREHLNVAARGIRRDMRRFWAWIVRRRWDDATPDVSADTRQSFGMLAEYREQVGESDEAAKLVGGVLYDLEQRRAVLAARLADPSIKSPVSDVLEHTHITAQLRAHYLERPDDAIAMRTATGLLSQTPGYQPPRLLGAVTGGLSWKLAAASAGLAVLFFGLWRMEDAAHDRDERELKQVRADYAAIEQNRQAWVTHARQQEAKLASVAASARATTETIEAERARARAAAAKKRKTDDAIKAALAGSAPPDWGSLLDDAPADAGEPAVSGGGEPDPAG